MGQPSSHQTGFTLVELIIIIAILGIVAGLFSLSFLRSIRTAELREVATQIAVDLRRARSQAQRGSAAMTVTMPGTASATSGATAYAVGPVQKNLPTRVRVYCSGNCGVASTDVTYQAPYGELGGTGYVFRVRSSMAGISDVEIRVVGVTGKVIVTGAGT